MALVLPSGARCDLLGSLPGPGGLQEYCTATASSQAYMICEQAVLVSVPPSSPLHWLGFQLAWCGLMWLQQSRRRGCACLEPARRAHATAPDSTADMQPATKSVTAPATQPAAAATKVRTPPPSCITQPQQGSEPTL